MSEQYQVRKALGKDLPAIMRIEHRTQQDSITGGGPDVRSGKESPADLFKEGLENEFLWVVESCDQVLGYCLASMLDGLFSVDDIRIDLTCRRKGCGTALLTAVSEYAGFLYCTAILATAMREEPWSEVFLRRHGFIMADQSRLPGEILQRQSRFRPPGAERIVMVKRL